MSIEEMMFNDPLHHAALFIWGLSGGLAQEVLRWRGLERRDRLPRFIKKGGYWALTLAFAVVGGLVAMLVGEHSPWGAFVVGASAPALISRAGVAATGKAQPVLGASGSLVDWLRG